MASSKKPRIGIALSGGGFRATLFHLGVVRLLHDAKLLGAVNYVGAVSGGSVLAAHLVLKWSEYTGTDESFAAAAGELIRFVGSDVRGRIVRRSIFAWVTLIPRFLLPKGKRWTFGNLLERQYMRLFQKSTLRDLRGNGRPQVFFNCTSSYNRFALLLRANWLYVV